MKFLAKKVYNLFITKKNIFEKCDNKNVQIFQTKVRGGEQQGQCR